MIAPIAFLLFLITLTTASPVAKRIVPISVCKTVATGTLSTANGHNLLLSSNILTYGKKGVKVEFQSCQPNFGHWNGTNNSPVGGHLVVKSTGKCLSIQEGQSAPPFTVTSSKCYYSDDSGQVFSNVIRKHNGDIFFAGVTQRDGSIIYFGSQCKHGFFGVSGSPTHGTAKLECADNHKHHIVGLRV